MAVPGLRTPTALFVVLTLVPATILAWLGWQASWSWVEELRRAAREQVERATRDAVARLPSRMGEVDLALARDLRTLAAAARQRLPEIGMGRCLTELEERFGQGALVLRAPDGALLLPRGPGSLARPWLPEWPRLLAFRLRCDAGDAGGAGEELVAEARAFEAPALRALALATALRDQGDRLAKELEGTADQALAEAGPLVCEVLRASEAGRARLARGLASGWLLEVPATEAARQDWLRDAGADAATLLRQALRARAQGGAGVLRLREPVADGVSLELLRDPELALAALDLGTTECAVQLGAAAELLPLRWTAPAAAHMAAPSPWGPTSVAVSHRNLPAIERDAERQRVWTGIGIVLLLLSSAAGVVLARRALVRERAARQLRDDFIANVSHELKTPLTSLRMYADMLAADALGPAERARYGKVAQAEGARLSALIDDLLDFAALERGTRRIEPEPVDLRAAADAVAEAWQPRAAQLGVELSRAGSAGEVVALADPKALLRILTNLLQNAFRHGRPARDGGTSRIALAVDPGPALEVRDNGPGVPEQDRERIFGRFERGAAGAAGAEGAGIGLALSRELAQACGGRLLCRDDGACTVFRLELPAVPETGVHP